MPKKYIKTKRMRRLLKQSRILEVKRLKLSGLWNSRNIELKLCSECDFLNCTCIRNQCASGVIKLYSNETN